MLKKSFIVLSFVLASATALFAQSSAANEIVLVMPFENTSGKPEFNWVGESFADSLSHLMKVPSMNVISNEQRKIVQQRLRIPLTTLPSLATSLKLARDSGATLLVTGRYTIFPASAELAATVNVNVKIIRIAEGRFLNERMPDGSLEIPPVELTDALGNLQTVQAQLAFKILYLQDRKTLAVSQNELIVAANKIPSQAFEAYIKGLLTPSLEARENYFINADRLYSKDNPDNIYADAVLELGHLYRDQRKFPEAVSSFERVVSSSTKCREDAKAANKRAQCSDELFAEASFYIGLIYWQQGNFESALATLRPLTEDLKLVSVYNALGAIAVQASRAEKKNQARAAALLTEGSDLLKKAVESAPDDSNVRFNYALALFSMGNVADAATHLRLSITGNPRDGEAYYLLAKVLETLKDPTTADINNQAQRFLTDNNRYAKLELEWQKSKSVGDIDLRVNQPARKDFVAVVLSRKPLTTSSPQVSETENLLSQARLHIKNGNDDDAMSILRRVRATEPMNAESYFLLGKINLRRGDIDLSISQFKTAIFWDNRIVEAHVSLGKIYIEKSDCQQAKNYVASAMEISPENSEVLALQRLSERCSK